MQQKAMKTYGLMGAVTAVSLLVAVALGSAILAVFESSLADARRWSGRSGSIAHVTQLATAANAPGNNVFQSNDVPGERAALRAAEQAFLMAHSATVAELATGVADPAATAAARAHLQALEGEFRKMVREADAVLDAMGAGQRDLAGEHMASMDAALAAGSDHAALAGTEVRRLQSAELDGEYAMAAKMRTGLFVLVGVVVALIAFLVRYGSSLSRMLRAQQELIEAANRDMSLILENASDGFVVVDHAGVVLGQPSPALTKLCGGDVRAGSPLARAFPKDAAATAAWFEVAFAALAEGVMPEDVLLSQLPERACISGRHVAFSWLPLADKKLLCVARDITDQVHNSIAEAVREDSLELLARWARDPAGTAAFVAEGREIVQQSFAADVVNRARALHTLKGNSAAWGLSHFANVVHELEDKDATDGLTGADLTRMSEMWRERVELVERMLSSGDRIMVPRAEFQALINRARAGAEPSSLVSVLQRWGGADASVSFQRLADYAVQLARRLERPTPDISIDANLHLDRERFEPVFSALVHVVRNAVDHGFDGGSAAPALRFAARADDRGVTLEIADNGRGIALDKLRGRARSLGVSANDDTEVLDLIWRDGYSTAEDITDTSGRGVGLAAVKAAVERAGGVVSVRTEAGRGTTFTFTFAAAPGEGFAAAAE